MDFAARPFAVHLLKTADSALDDLGKALPVALAMIPVTFYKGFAEEMMTKGMRGKLTSMSKKMLRSANPKIKSIGAKLKSPTTSASIGRGVGKATTGFGSGLLQAALLSHAIG